MIRHTKTLLSVITLVAVNLVALSADLATAQQTYTETKDGITYRVTRRTVQRPVLSHEVQERQQVHYREHVTTEINDHVRTYNVPVTEYQWVTRLHGRWNPFVQPYYTQQLTPVTRWEARSEVVSTPVTRRQLLPETRTVKVTVPVVRYATEEITTRVVLNGPAMGGIAKLDNDPPRQFGQDSTRR